MVKKIEGWNFNQSGEWCCTWSIPFGLKKNNSIFTPAIKTFCFLKMLWFRTLERVLGQMFDKSS